MARGCVALWAMAKLLVLSTVCTIVVGASAASVTSVAAAAPSVATAKDSKFAAAAKVSTTGRTNGTSVPATPPSRYDEIYERLQRHTDILDGRYVDLRVVAERVTKGLYPGISDDDIDNLTCETAAYMATEHPDYAKLAARVSTTSMHRKTCPSFSETVDRLFHYVDPKTNLPAGFVSKKIYDIVMANRDRIDAFIKHNRDFNFDYFGLKTLERSYLFKIGEEVVERPQYMFMRVALGIHMEDADPLEAAFETYDLMSDKWFTHASPTLFSAGTQRPQLSSCFLLGIEGDSIDGIYSTLSKCALISKEAGGIGLSVQNIRAKGSYIRGTKGTSNGLVPMLRVYDATARYVDQGGGKRPGAFAIYIEPWHADIFEVLDLRKNTGKEENRARDLFYGLWVPDLFMKRVEEDGEWGLMCPAECPGLDDMWGAEFEALYESYMQQGKARKVVRARDLWYAILDAQMETGTPYMLYKDACNAKSNQQNLGTIKCSNLCTEIIQYTSPSEVAVCNLASIVLSKFVVVLDMNKDAAQIAQLNPANIYGRDEGKKVVYVYDHEKLRNITKVVTRNLNKIIDINFYAVAQAEQSNKRHRPIGLGVQGLADAFQMIRLPFDSPEARRLNKDIFETMYYASLEASCDLARTHGPYETYSDSPAARGQLQYDMWGVQPSARWDWQALKGRISEHGLRNSLLMAPMPTASTAQILGNNECFEPYTSNMYVRRVRAGEFIILNPHLVNELISRGLWSKEIRDMIMASGGSVQNIPEIPEEIREIYRTVWEIRQRSLIDMAADRGAFIDQSQSLNMFMQDADYAKLTSMHFHGWRRGLKTGMYYLRTKAAVNAIQFTLDPSKTAKKGKSARAGAGSGMGRAAAAGTGSGAANVHASSTPATADSIARTMHERDGRVDDSRIGSDGDDDFDDGDGDSGDGGGEQIYGEACISCSG